MALTGAKIRSRLKMVMTLSKINRNLALSLARRIFDVPTRARAPIGSKATLYPALMKAIDDQNKLRGGGANRRLHRGAVAFVIRMPNHAGAGACGRIASAIRRTIVHNQDFVPRRGGAQRGHNRTDAVAFVEGGHDDRHG